jgi:hypothetical protein
MRKGFYVPFYFTETHFGQCHTPAFAPLRLKLFKTLLKFSLSDSSTKVAGLCKCSHTSSIGKKCNSPIGQGFFMQKLKRHLVTTTGLIGFYQTICRCRTIQL